VLSFSRYPPRRCAFANILGSSYDPKMTHAARDFRDLSVAERIQLVEDIWDSIAVEGSEAVQLTDAQRQELSGACRRMTPIRPAPFPGIRFAPSCCNATIDACRLPA
jgi:putative addiction module component (TIGR02574 family)